MKRYLLILIMIGGCAARPVYSPRQKCPELPTLPNPATESEKDRWIAEVSDIYLTCAASRRTCKYSTMNPQTTGSK